MSAHLRTKITVKMENLEKWTGHPEKHEKVQKSWLVIFQLPFMISFLLKKHWMFSDFLKIIKHIMALLPG